MQSQTILGDNLTGIYLHGSAAMGCFNNRKSDVDLLVVVKDEVSKEYKRKFMDMVAALKEYQTEETTAVNNSVATEFAVHILE